MEAGHFRDEGGLGVPYILDGLARHRFRQEANEVAGMAGSERQADLAVMLHAADAGPVSSPRVDDHEGALGWVGDRALRGDDPHQAVADGPLEAASVKDQLGIEIEDVGRFLLRLFTKVVAALAKHVE